MGNRSFHTYTRDKLKPRIFQEESAKQFHDWKSKMNVLIRQARKFLSGYCTQVTALQLSVDRVSTLEPKLVAARSAVQKSSKRTSVADMKLRTRTLDNLQVVLEYDKANVSDASSSARCKCLVRSALLVLLPIYSPATFYK